MKPYKIAIVGSGIAGLSAAAFLHQSGHNVSILEEFETPSPLGAGLLLQPTGLAVLSQLGLDAEIIKRGSRINSLYGKGAGLKRTTLDVKYSDLNPKLFGVGSHRGTLFSCLYNHALKLSIPIHTNSKIERVSSGHITTSNGEQSGPFDLIVDASGANSSLRDQYANVTFNREYPFGALWATVTLPDTGFLDDRLEQRYKGAYHMAGVLPVGVHQGTNRAAFFWSIKKSDYPLWCEQDVNQWKDYVGDLWPESRAIVDQFNSHSDLTFATYRDVKLKHLSANNIVFTGDAAHCTSPQLGQGANLALVDAMILSKCINDSESLKEGIFNYSVARKNHIRFYQIASRWLTPFFQSDSSFFSKMRFFTCDLMCHIPPARYIAAEVLTGTKTGIFSSLNPGEWASEYDSRNR